MTLTSGGFAASPSASCLAVVLSTRVSVCHPCIRMLAAFASCISRSSSSPPTPSWSHRINESLLSQQLNECYEGLRLSSSMYATKAYVSVLADLFSMSVGKYISVRRYWNCLWIRPRARK